MRVSRCICVAALWLAPAPAAAQPSPGQLTLEGVLASARARSPEVVVAEARVDETRARLVGARVRFRDNPVVDFSAGPRRAANGGTSTDLDVGVSQSFETGARRSARIVG